MRDNHGECIIEEWTIAACNHTHGEEDRCGQQRPSKLQTNIQPLIYLKTCQRLVVEQLNKYFAEHNLLPKIGLPLMPLYRNRHVAHPF